MKPYCSILVFILISIEGFSQSNNRLTVVQGNSMDDRLFLEQHLWGYSRSSSEKSNRSLMDFNVIDNWRGLGNYLAVSNDGNFISYTINKPTSTPIFYPILDSLVVQSTYNGWRFAVAGSEPGFFTANDKKYIFKNGETLCFLPLDKPQLRSVKDVISYKVSQHGKNEWLAWQLKGNDSTIVLQNLVTGKEISFNAVIDYNFDKSGEWLVCKQANDLLLYNLITGTQKQFPSVAAYAFASNGKAALLKTAEKSNNSVTIALKYLAAPAWKEKIIWIGNKEKTDISSYSIDNSGRQVGFSQDSIDTRIWYYNATTDIAKVSVTNTSAGLTGELTIKGDVYFSDNDRYLKFFVQSLPDSRKPDPEMAQVEIWDHKDLYLQSAEAGLSKRPKVYIALFNIENGKVMPLGNNGKKLYLQQGDFAVVKKDPTSAHGDRFWEVRNSINNDSNWLVSLKDGSSQLLPTRAGNLSLWFSPNGKYLVYFDADKGSHYFSYDLVTGVLRDISVNVGDNQLNLSDRYKDGKADFGSPAAWLSNDAGLLVYDDYDIWKLDLAGKEPAINVTNLLGRSNGILFNLFTTNRFYFGKIPVIKINEPLLLRAFDVSNKQIGFYQKKDLQAPTLEPLYMGSYFMNKIMGCHDPNLSNEGLAPVKAEDRETWIVQRQSSTDAPNYYETNDFRNFKRVTNFQPQQNYRWLSEELHAFKHLDGRMGQGILYKPDNFDSTKKYPVLIVLYGAFSNNLNQFHVPNYINHDIEPGMSPVWMVSNGYLVFTPDMYVTPLTYGPSAFNVVEGAAQYLKQLPYVDAGKLGCTSHSWSGKLGAYLFTHSGSFSATAMSEGFAYADVINTAFSITEDGSDRLETAEREQGYGSLWENKESWLDNTAVLQADKAKSPLLLFSNKQSSLRAQDETRRLFIALRRLDKKVWWLSYENGSHTLFDLKELKDYTIRYTQFFDHYLKEAPAPLWMTQGLPLGLKGVESRYALDPKGSCGKDCTICKKWNEQYKKHPEMFDKPIREWHLE